MAIYVEIAIGNDASNVGLTSGKETAIGNDASGA
jgi:hypothetical protein